MCKTTKKVETFQILKIVPLNETLFSVLLSSSTPLLRAYSGQFVQIKVDENGQNFLRIPISIHHIDIQKGQIELLIRKVGAGTDAILSKKVGDSLDIIYPLGNHFGLPRADLRQNLLLVGGGVGIAPLLLLGAELQALGHRVNFLLGAKTASDLVLLERYEQLGQLYLTTEDGSLGERGFVTGHSALQQISFDKIYTCGPTPMMKSVATYAHSKGIVCEASLENLMACGLGVCLCCVEKTKKGHLCVCTDGPVFNTNQLLWQI